MEEFLVTGASMESFEKELKTLRDRVASLEATNGVLVVRMGALLDRLEIEDARKQNSMIRTHQPVPAFKASSSSEAAAAPFFSFAPSGWHRR